MHLPTILDTIANLISLEQKQKNMHTMHFTHSLPPIATTSLLLLLFTSLPPTTLSQDSTFSPSGPTLADCSMTLLPLASCAPFVQGSVETPPQPCCSNLKQVYIQQQDCLCLLLNNTSIGSFPINRTLALQLPLLCNLQVDVSTCSGMLVPPGSPDSQVSLGPNTNSSVVAASPMIAVAPRPSVMGLGFGRNAGVKLKMKGGVVAAAAAATTFLLARALY